VVALEHLGERHDLVPTRLGLEPRRQVHRGAEQIDPVVRAHDEAWALVQADAHGEVGHPQAARQRRGPLAQLERGGEPVTGVGKARHEPVPQRLRHRALVAPHHHF
jgi:hypothetical protein